MAQVKKLKNGSIIKAKEGTLTIGTKSLSGDTALERILNAANTTDPTERVFFSGAANAVRDGMDVVYDPINYTMDVYDSNNNNVTGQYLNTAVRTSDSRFKKTWDATVGNQRDKDRRSAVAFSKVNLDTEAPVAKELLNLTKGNNEWFVYEKDDKGNLVKDENGSLKLVLNSPTNLKLRDLVGNVHKYVTEEGFRNQYSKQDWLTSIYDAFNSPNLSDEQKAQFWEGLDSRIQSGTLTNADREWLAMMGIVEGKPKDTGGGNTGDSSKKGDRVPKDSKIDASYLDDDISIVKGDDGNYYVVGGDDDYWASRNLSGEAAFANSAWRAGFVNNRRLYTPQEAQATTGKLGETFADWYSAASIADYGQRYKALRDTGIKFKNGDDTNDKDDWYDSIKYYNTSTMYNPYWHNYFKKAGAGYYKPIVTNDPNRHIIMVPGAYDRENGFTSQYLIYNDATGEMIPIEGNFNDWLTANHLVSISGKNEDAANESTWYSTPKGQMAVAATINSDVTGENTILVDRNNQYWLARAEGTGENIRLTRPRRIYDQARAKEIVYNAAKRKELAEKNNAELIKEVIGKIPDNQKALQNYYENNYISSVPWKKTGGHIPTWKDLDSAIKKYQFGGVADKQKNTIKELDTSKAKADLSKSHALNGSDGGLTNAEKAQIGAAIADLSGIALTFAPDIATNIAGAGLGFGATIAKQRAIRQRTGSTKGLLGDILLDTASLIPVVGGFAKSAKALKTIIAVAEPLAKAMGIAGAVEGANTVRKVAKQGKWTTDDATTIIQALGAIGMGTASVRRSMGESKLAAKVSAKDNTAALAKFQEVKPAKIGDTANKITESQESLAKLINSHKGDSTEILKAIREKHNIPDGITDAQITKTLKEGFGIEVKAGKFNILHPIKTWKRVNRSDKFKTGDTPAGNSAWYYAKHPFKRFRTLNEAKTLGTVEELQAAAEAPLFKWDGNTERLALQRWSAFRPEAFAGGENLINTGMARSWFRPWYTNFKKYSYTAPAITGEIPLMSNSVLASPNNTRIILPPNVPQWGLAGKFTYPNYGTTIFYEKSGGSIPKFQKPYQPLGISYDKTKTKKWYDDLYQGDYGKALEWLKNNPTERAALIADINAGKYNEGVKQMNGVKIGENNWYEQATNYKYGPVHNAFIKWSEVNKDKYSTTTTPIASSTNIASSSINTPNANNANDASSIIDSIRKKHGLPTGQQYTAEESILSTPFRPLPFKRTSAPSVEELKSGNPKLSVTTNPTASESMATRALDYVNGSKDPMLDRYTNGIDTPLGKRYFNYESGKFDLTSPSTISSPTTTYDINFTNQRRSGDAGGFYGKERWALDPAHAIDVFRANWAASDIWRDWRINKDALGRLAHRQFYAPQLEQLRYNFSDIDHGENMAKRPYLQQDFVTPDLREQMAFDLSKASAISGIEDKYNAARSQSKAAVDNANVDIRNKQSQIDSDLANTRSKYYTELAYQDKMLDSQAINALHTNVIDPLLRQWSSEFKAIDDSRRSLAYQAEAADAARWRRDQIAAKTNDLKRRYNADKASGATSATTFTDWLEENDSRYDEYLGIKNDEALNKEYYDKLLRAQGRLYLYPSIIRTASTTPVAGVASAEKGGTISKNRSSFDSNGRIAVNLSKGCQKALDKIRDNLAKRLLVLLK